MHGKAVEREQRLKEKLQAARAKLKELRQRLRERWARRRGSEKRTRSAGGSEAAAAAPRRRGQQRGAPGHGRRQHAHLPVQVEAHDVEPERRRCPACGDEYGAHGSEDSEQLEIEVRAYRRVIKRRRYRRSCQCAAAPALLTAAAPPRLIPKGILGISVWVTVLIDKYLLYRPTYRLLADLRAHGLDLAQGTVTDGMRRLAPLFAPLREALIARSRTGQHWHADETRWQVFEADSEDACQRWCLWVFWSAEVVVFTLDPTRSARVPKQHFATVTGGVVSVDRYSAYKRLAKDTALVLSFCWVHVRRDFITIANERDDQEEWAEQWLADIAALYHLNDERLQVRAEPTQYAAADAALRAGVQAMQERRERELAQQPKLPAACAKVLRSLRNHWQGLTLFVEDPDLPMDNNQAERALRGPVVGRKNYYGGAGAQSRFHGAGSQPPPPARRLAGSLRLPTAPAGDLRAVRPLRRYQLPRRQLDPRRSDPRPRQTGRASYPRAAQERHLALPAQARLPPPTLHPAGSSSPPVDRIFTLRRRYTQRTTEFA